MIHSLPRAFWSMASIAPCAPLSDASNSSSKFQLHRPIRIGVKQNLSTLMQPSEIEYLDEHTKALANAIEVMTEQDQTRRDQRANATAYEIAPFNIKSATALAKDASIDKVIICIRHGESEHNSFEQEWKRQGKDINEAIHHEDYPRDPILTKRVSCLAALGSPRFFPLRFNVSYIAASYTYFGLTYDRDLVKH